MSKGIIIKRSGEKEGLMMKFLIFLPEARIENESTSKTYRVKIGCFVDWSPTITVIDCIAISVWLCFVHITKCLSTGCRHGFHFMLLCLPLLTALFGKHFLEEIMMDTSKEEEEEGKQ